MEKKFSTKEAHYSLDCAERTLAYVFSDLAKGSTATPGRLAQVIEGAGKRRIFAIGNFVKQRLLYPVHVWAMNVLARIDPYGWNFPPNGTH